MKPFTPTRRTFLKTGTAAAALIGLGSATLRQAAAQDAKVALYELAAAQLDTVANVKRAYYDLAFSERSERILRDNRRLAVDFLAITKSRYETAGAGNLQPTDHAPTQSAILPEESTRTSPASSRLPVTDALSLPRARAVPPGQEDS